MLVDEYNSSSNRMRQLITAALFHVRASITEKYQGYQYRTALRVHQKGTKICMYVDHKDGPLKPNQRQDYRGE
jgi:hypothetical protein